MKTRTKISTFFTAVLLGASPIMSYARTPDAVEHGKISKTTVEKATNVSNDNAGVPHEKKCEKLLYYL